MAPLFQMKVKVIQPHVYAGIQRYPGDEYDMEERFVFAMSTLGHVLRIDDPAIQTRDLQSEQPKKYRRRDLRAD
jgi:hypothetical protein